jgi:flagellar P-ring protein precursor FlgI
MPVRDLTTIEGARPVRLVGYGLVTGLSGTGDRVTGGAGARHTVQSVVNLLRNFDVQVPAELIRTRNVAAVLVTAEVSPYLRAGGRFDIHVSSVGDAQSLRGGILWMTPLVAEAGGQALAVAQGSVLVSESGTLRNASRLATSARVSDGGVMETSFPPVERERETRLLLRDPDVGTAQRIVEAIKTELRGDAKIEDPGSILVELPRGDDGLAFLARIQDLRVPPTSVARLLVDARDGTIAAGADLVVLDGVVSADGITLAIGGAAADPAAASGETIRSGARVRDVMEALRVLRASPQQTSAIFLALRDAGAIRAEVIVR